MLSYILLFLVILCSNLCFNSVFGINDPSSTGLIGIIFSSKKDISILNTVLRSVIEHLSFDIIYVIVPGDHYSALRRQYASRLPFQKVRVVNEEWLRVPISKKDVAPMMIERLFRTKAYGVLSHELQIKQAIQRAKEEKGVQDWKEADKLAWEKKWKTIPLSELEVYVATNAGWYWQQLLKLLIGRALNLPGDYVVLDGDVVWYKNVNFLDSCAGVGVSDTSEIRLNNDGMRGFKAKQSRLAKSVTSWTAPRDQSYISCRYNYVSSLQYHKPYLKTLKQLLGIDFLKPSGLSAFQGFGGPARHGPNQYRSGISHHMAFVRPVLESLLDTVEQVQWLKAKNDSRFVDPELASDYAYLRGTTYDMKPEFRSSFSRKSKWRENDNTSAWEGDELDGEVRHYQRHVALPRKMAYPTRLSFAEIFLMYAADHLVCGLGTMCASSHVSSEYELYFQYARLFYPTTVRLRPLLWANGPQPGRLYWPEVQTPVTFMDRARHMWKAWGGGTAPLPAAYMSMAPFYDVRNPDNWLAPPVTSERSASNLALSPLWQLYFDRQMLSDASAEYDFVAYHAYMLNRGFEIHDEDVVDVCKSLEKPVPEPDLSLLPNACSLKGRFDNVHEHDADWHFDDNEIAKLFRGCACNSLLQIQVRKKR